jgi:hypothetical protein
VRLLGVSVLSILSFALLIFGAQALGQSQPPPVALRGLHLTDCALPCWNGITVGQTQRRFAYRQLVSQYEDVTQRFFADQAMIYILHEQEMSRTEIEMYIDESGRVQQVTLYIADGSGLLLGDIMNLYGEPSEIEGVPPLILAYQCASGHVVVATDTHSGTGWQTPVGMISISQLNTMHPLVPCKTNDPARAPE